MAQFTIGDRVMHTDSNVRGVVLDVMPPRRGRQLYRVDWGNQNISDELEVNLNPDVNISDPYDRCAIGLFGSYSEYSKKNTTFKIQSSNNSTISSLKASKTLFRAYQFKPLLKFLNSPNRRLLVADEVGLGKTIEAGHIMLELKARHELHNVLIICPKSLQQKWKDELDFKFGLQFKIYDKQTDLIADMNEHRVAIHAIINYEKIRLRKLEDDEDDIDEELDDFDDADEQVAKRKKRKKKERVIEPDKYLIDYLTVKEFKFSLVLCDEAHKMRNSQTQTYRGAEIIMSQTDAVVFLTATPVMIGTENLYNLLHLLDNVRYNNFQIFDNRLEENRPFVFALTELNKGLPLLDIYEKLSTSEITKRYYREINKQNVLIQSRTSTIAETFADDAMYLEIARLLQGEDTPKNRARLQYLFSSISVMSTVFSRTRKREVTTDLSQAERKPHLVNVHLTEEERAEFDTVIEEYIDDNSYTDYWGEERLTMGGALGLVQKKRQVASSVYAYLNEEESLDKGIDLYSNKTDAKVEKLIEIITEVFSHGTKKIVIFALFRKTLKYLQLRLGKRGFGTLMIHGMVNNRAEILDEFRNNPDAHILLSSEVGSEGLDMQFCNSMVNYDLPWNPMVVEQRIGRIDRFGQKSPVVNIYNMVVEDSIQETIYERLLERIGIFKGTIGDMEAILDAPMGDNSKMTIQDFYNKLEKDLYISELTDEEINQKIEQIELAIANEKENIKHLEEGLDTALTNDAYFKNEISRIQNNNAYVTEFELRNYLEAVIRAELTTCSLVDVGDRVYELRLPPSNPKVLRNFLTRYQPTGEEHDVAFRHFKNDIEDLQAIQMTFNQDKAYENSHLLFINIYNPIIQACLEYFKQKEDANNTSFSYSIPADKQLTKNDAYYLVIYRIIVSRRVMGTKKYTETLLPLAFDINNNRLVDDEELIDHIFSLTQQSGREHNAENQYIDAELLQDIRYDFAERVSKAKKERISELKLQIESDKQRNEQQTIEYYDSIINNTQQFISQLEWQLEGMYVDAKEEKRIKSRIATRKGYITRKENEREEKLLQIREPDELDIKDEIISLNLIKVI